MTISSDIRSGLLHLGSEGPAVEAVQTALSTMGYRITVDGDFGPATEHFVCQFQRQHGLPVDGIVGPDTSALLDAPYDAVTSVARPLVTVGTCWPHDDTASLLAFYGRPWENPALLARVPVPFPMTYESSPVHEIQFHSRGAGALGAALRKIASLAQSDSSVLRHVRRFSGGYNYRPVRGSSRLSCHAFGAAVDFDAEGLPLGTNVPASEIPQVVVNAFKEQGFFWGGDYLGRKDPMHFQLAHE